MKLTRKETLRWAGLILLMAVCSRVVIYLAFVSLGEGYYTLNEFLNKNRIFDANWYISIASEGYVRMDEGTGQAALAFFPLYPLLMRLGSFLTRRSLFVSGVLVNMACFMAHQLVAVFYILETGRTRENAFWYLFFINFGLYSFYFSTAYTEGLFLLLLSCAMLLWRRERFLGAGMFGALATLTRNTGIFLVFFFLLDYLEKERMMQGRIHFREIFADGIRQEKMVLGAVLTPLGLFLYAAYLKHLMGDGLAFMHIQKAWGKIPFTEDFRVLFFDYGGPVYLGVAFLLILFLLLAGLEEKRYSEWVLPAAVVLTVLSVRISSLPRYMLGMMTPLLFFTDKYVRLNRLWKTAFGVAILFLAFLFDRSWLLSMSTMI